jgi:hypothetical protein
MIDGARECEDMTVGWYDLRGVTGLFLGKLESFFSSDSL